MSRICPEVSNSDLLQLHSDALRRPCLCNCPAKEQLLIPRLEVRFLHGPLKSPGDPGVCVPRTCTEDRPGVLAVTWPLWAACEDIFSTGFDMPDCARSGPGVEVGTPAETDLAGGSGAEAEMLTHLETAGGRWPPRSPRARNKHRAWMRDPRGRVRARLTRSLREPSPTSLAALAARDVQPRTDARLLIRGRLRRLTPRPSGRGPSMPSHTARGRVVRLVVAHPFSPDGAPSPRRSGGRVGPRRGTRSGRSWWPDPAASGRLAEGRWEA